VVDTAFRLKTPYLDYCLKIYLISNVEQGMSNYESLS